MDIPMVTDIAVAIAGSVDSGKSTFIGVCIGNNYDDGNGSARTLVAIHPHEIETGRTSAISTRVYNSHNGHGITFIDLCGHEKYFKTTSFGVSGYFPDYAFVTVSANRGVLLMTKQHIRILLSFSIPIVFIITHIDLAPKDSYELTKQSIQRVCLQYSGKIVIVNDINDEDTEVTENNAVQNIMSCLTSSLTNIKQIVFPVISISNKTGFFFNAIRKLLTFLTPVQFWNEKIKIIKMFQSKLDPIMFNNIKKEPFTGSLFYIDSIYNPVGIGLVACGILRGDSIHVNDSLIIGPFGKEFIDIKVKSIHNNNRQIIPEITDHLRGCIAFASKKEIKRRNIKTGTIILSSIDSIKHVCFHFKASILVFNTSTTIKSGYTPIIHLSTIRQTAILRIDPSENEGRDIISSGVVSIVTFKFIIKPEFVEPFNVFVFRNGNIEGIGMVLSTLSITDDVNAKPEIYRKVCSKNQNKKLK